MTTISDISLFAPPEGDGYGIAGAKTREEGMEMLCILKGLTTWPEQYDIILQKVSRLEDAYLKDKVSKNLLAWEERRIPKLLELKSRFVIEEQAEPDFQGMTVTKYLVEGLDTPDKRKPVIKVLLKIVKELVEIISDIQDDSEEPQALSGQPPAALAAETAQDSTDVWPISEDEPLSEVEIEIEGDKPEESPAAKTPGPRRAKRPKSLTQLASLYQPRF